MQQRKLGHDGQTVSAIGFGAMSIGIAQGCSGCIAYHGERALGAGASRDEFLDAVGVAVLMAGGPGAVYAGEALEVLDGADGA